MSLYLQSIELICWTAITTLWFCYNMLHSFFSLCKARTTIAIPWNSVTSWRSPGQQGIKPRVLELGFFQSSPVALLDPQLTLFSMPGFVIEHITLPHAGSRVKSHSWIISCALRLYIPKNKDHLHSTYSSYKPCPLCTTDIEIPVAKHHCFLHTFSSKLLRKSLHASWILLTISIRIG